MAIDETVVAVMDLEPSGSHDPPPSPDPISDEPRGAIETGLLVAVGLAVLAIEGVARAIVSATGEPLPQIRETADEQNEVEDGEEGAATGEGETVAMIAGAGVSLAFGAARFLTRMVAGLDRTIRPLSVIAMAPPVDRAARRLERSAIELNAGWRGTRLESRRAAEAFADALVPQLIDAVIDRLDLTHLVLERVDLDRVTEAVAIDRLIERVDLDDVVARVDIGQIIQRVDPATIVDRLDVDAVAARVDVQRIVDGLDLVAIARGVIDELDLPEIIRGSTETMAAETRDGVRVQGMRADRFVSRLVDRALLRGNGADAAASGDAGSTEDPL
jgi:hypothetical protein